MTCATKNAMAMILFNLCTIFEVQNADNAMTFKILSGDTLREVYAITTSSVSAQSLPKLLVTTAVPHDQQFIAIKLN